MISDLPAVVAAAASSSRPMCADWAGAALCLGLLKGVQRNHLFDREKCDSLKVWPCVAIRAVTRRLPLIWVRGAGVRRAAARGLCSSDLGMPECQCGVSTLCVQMGMLYIASIPDW